MELIALVGLLAFFLIIGTPIAFALGVSSLLVFFMLDIPAIVAIQRITSGVSVFTLMAIPFFIFAGNLMHHSGIAERLVNVANAAFGRARGGLGQVNIGASMMFGAVSGSAVASVSAIGATLTPMMKNKGYDPDYIVNVSSTAAITGLLIPPSHNMIIYAAAAGVGVSIGDLFLAGLVPGFLTGFLLMSVAWIVARRRGYPAGTFPGWGVFLRSFISAAPGLMTALIIIVGILSGIFTPTESSAIAVVYTMLIAFFAYRSLSMQGFKDAVLDAVQTTSMVMMIIGSAAAFGWILAYLEGPVKLAELMLTITENPILLLLLINIILLLLGTFMDMAPLIIITTPIFLPIAAGLGMDPIQFGVMMMLNLGIGLVTPPVGSVLFVGCAVGGLAIEKTIRTIWPILSCACCIADGDNFHPFPFSYYTEFVLMPESFPQVSPDTQTVLNDTVQQVPYDRDAVGVGQVHLGIGAFFKAHQAVYTEEAIARSGGHWRVCGVSLKRPVMRDQLAPQSCLYTVTSYDSDTSHTRLVGVLDAVLVAPENPAAVIDVLADAAIKVITLTITEKGYCLDPATGALDFTHPDIRHDLDNLKAPTSAIGFLVAGLKARVAQSIPLPTIISCDNLPDNGTLLHKAVLDFAAKVSADLAETIEAKAAFPINHG